MFKFRRLLCAVLVCALVGVAYGAAHKIRSFVPYGAEQPTADGMAILNFADSAILNGGKTIVQVVVSGFTPNTTYDVGICLPYFSCIPDEIGQTGGTYMVLDAFTTDGDGSGTFHGELSSDYSSSNVAIYHRNPDGTIPEGGYLRALGN